MVVKKRGFNPWMISSDEKMSTSQTKNMAMTKLKRLKVIILKGKVILLRMGLTAKFKIPKRIPAKVKVFSNLLKSVIPVGKINKKPLKSTPGMNLSASQRPKIPEIIWSIKYHTLLSYQKAPLESTTPT